MANRTIQDLAREVLIDLGRLDFLAEPRPEDKQRVERRYLNILDELADEDLVYWDADSIPKEVFEALIGLMRLVVGPGFGIPGTVDANLDAAMEGAKRRIRRRVRKPASGEPQRVDDF